MAKMHYSTLPQIPEKESYYNMPFYGKIKKPLIESKRRLYIPLQWI